MKYRRLGFSGLHVSNLCLGTMMFGGQASEETCGRIISIARDAGVNFIDTSDRYAMGKSESILGKFLRRDRDRWVLATKVCGPMGDGPNQRGLGRKWIFEEVEHSLRRLETDYIDLYYLHFRDEGTPIEETIRAMGDLIRDGRVRYWGVSNFTAWQLAEVVHLSDFQAVPRPIALQPLYNAMNRMAEVEVMPACDHYGVGIVPYSPLARGVLTGKYVAKKTPVKGSRAGRKDARMMETEWRSESLALAGKIKVYAEKHGTTPLILALNWVLNNDLVTSVTAGPRTVSQWRAYIKALDYEFRAADEAFFDSLVSAGHPSTHGYTDPKSPVTGRNPRA